MSTSVLKVIAAFVAGIVVALGSALFYVRINEVTAPAHDILQIPPATRQTPDRIETTPSSQAPVAQTAHPTKRLVAKTVTKPAVNHVAKPAPGVHAKARTVEVAQQLPPTPVAPVTPPSVFVPPSAPPPTKVSAVDPAPVMSAPTAPAPAPERHVITLQPGTNLAIRLGETLSTDHNYSGDTFRGTLDAPIIIDGFIIADRGSKVLGTIVTAQKAGRMVGTANLDLALTEINTTDGQRVVIETNTYAKQGNSNNGEKAAKMAGGAALGAVIGALTGGGRGAAIGAGVGGAAGTGAVLLTHGKPAVLSAETKLTFQLSKPTVITEKLN